MAQFNTKRNAYVPNNDTIHEHSMVSPGPNVYIQSGNLNTGTDAFGRMRVALPTTLFDSSHRFAKNDLWAETTSGTASATFNADAGLVEMDVDAANGDEIIRETFKVFSYQPGKSLLVLTTFVLAEAKANLRQRVGYFGTSNGMFLELDGTTTSFVKRSAVSGSVVDTHIPQGQWNVDKMDGTGPSGIVLDISKAQIMWTDIEWLGVGSVRLGFVINGQFVVCHIIHHANIETGTYITTASLPLRQEITNTGDTSGPSKAKQICASVMSEGGYELRGRQHGVETPIALPYELTTADTYYPVISIRLKSGRRDAIAILTAASILGVSTAHYNWKIIASGVSTGGTWVSAGANSSVEYKTTGTSFSGGRTLASGWTSTTNQAAGSIDLLKEALFKFQLERDSLAGISFELTLVMGADAATSDVYASLDWEEVTR